VAKDASSVEQIAVTGRLDAKRHLALEALQVRNEPDDRPALIEYTDALGRTRYPRP
jgi:hypothetical protein